MFYSPISSIEFNGVQKRHQCPAEKGVGSLTISVKYSVMHSSIPWINEGESPATVYTRL
jgi:hypothetical protein